VKIKSDLLGGVIIFLLVGGYFYAKAEFNNCGVRAMRITEYEPSEDVLAKAQYEQDIGIYKWACTQ
jgi:hypothetical protein